MKLGLVGGLAGLGLLALMGTSQAAVLTIRLNDYDPAVDPTPGVTQATMTVTDATGGVNVKLTTATSTSYLAVSGGGHITIAWNRRPGDCGHEHHAYHAYLHGEDGSNRPAGVFGGDCGTFTNGLQGTLERHQ